MAKRLNEIRESIDVCSQECFKTIQGDEFTHDLNELIEAITKIYQVDSRISELFDGVLPLLNHYNHTN